MGVAVASVGGMLEPLRERDLQREAKVRPLERVVGDRNEAAPLFQVILREPAGGVGGSRPEQ
jgi:hypothetical protein